MKNIFSLLGIKPHERPWVVAATVLVVLLQVVCVQMYWQEFSVPAENYHSLFVKRFLISGFDPLTYEVLSDWGMAYNIVRHPFLPYYLYPLYLLNQGLMALLGVNCAQILVALLWGVLAVCGFVWLYRLLHEVMGVTQREAGWLSVLTYAMGYTLLTVMVPDHFLLSMSVLIGGLYLMGKYQKLGKPLQVWQSAALFVLTAGISLNNGVKMVMAAFFTNGRRFFKPLFLMLGIVLPALLVWWSANRLSAIYEEPGRKARQALRLKAAAKERAEVWKQYADTASTNDSAVIAKGVQRILNARAWEKYRRDHQKPWNAHTGKPFVREGFWSWTDATTSRWDTVVENLFGESLLLHEDYLLGDTLKNRPVVVHYRFWPNYVVNGVLVCLFVLGIVLGIKQRMLLTALSFWLFDMGIHLVLGFGINEIYIMSGHWAFVYAIAIACALKRFQGTIRVTLRTAVVVLAVYMLVWNLVKIVEYCCL